MSSRQNKDQLQSSFEMTNNSAAYDSLSEHELHISAPGLVTTEEMRN
jgi:hypothetical protein